jgi:hypothetical protein
MDLLMNNGAGGWIPVRKSLEIDCSLYCCQLSEHLSWSSQIEQRFGIPIAQGYGCSEIGWIATNPGANRHFGTVGKPLPYHQLAVIDDRGQPLLSGAHHRTNR